MANAAEINLTLKIHSNKNPVDMDYALETLAGCSAVVSTLANSILSEDVLVIRSAGDDIRTQLMDGYTGSYVQNFKIKIDSAIKAKALRSLGNSVFSELMQYFFYEAMYLSPPKLSLKAEQHLKKMEKVEGDVLDKIKNRLKQMHKISKMNNYPVSLKRTSSNKDIVVINSTTASNIFTSSTDNVQIKIKVMITRFNSFTGNGRLLCDGDNNTVSFGFYGPLRAVQSSFMRKVSGNLHKNNRVKESDRKYLNLTVIRVFNISGDIIKYLVIRVD